MKLNTLNRMVKWFEEYQPDLQKEEAIELYTKLVDEEFQEYMEAKKDNNKIEKGTTLNFELRIKDIEKLILKYRHIGCIPLSLITNGNKEFYKDLKINFGGDNIFISPDFDDIYKYKGYIGGVKIFDKKLTDEDLNSLYE